MTKIYKNSDPLPIKIAAEAVCLTLLYTRLALSMDVPYMETKVSDEFLEEMRLHRCLMERMLRSFSESLFVDYQCEKFGSVYKQNEADDEDKTIGRSEPFLLGTRKKWFGVDEFETRLTAPCALCKWNWKQPTFQNCDDCPIEGWCAKVMNFDSNTWLSDVKHFNIFLDKEISQRTSL